MEREKEMDTKKRNMIIGAAAAAVLILVVGLLAAFGVFHGFNPEGYVKAVLDQSLKGEVRSAAQLMAGTTEDSLYQQYEQGITSFVKNSIANGVELDEELEGKYVELCKKVFSAMKYDIEEAKDAEGGGYDVTVSYYPANVFTSFMTKIGEENQRITEKVENGEYRGTLEEINAQMQKDFMNNAYVLFEECSKSIEYGEEETFVFSIVKDEEGMYDLDEAQISEFITKILNLDENQG